MSNHNQDKIEIPPFDALSGQVTPFLGFGDILSKSPEVETQFFLAIADAKRRIEGGFDVRLNIANETAKELDKIIIDMWESGWNPKTGNINLFAFDFGCILAKIVLAQLGGQPTFRSSKEMNHFSIFWANKRLEAFPFHKALKCLHIRQGETMTSFVNGLANKLNEKGNQRL